MTSLEGCNPQHRTVGKLFLYNFVKVEEGRRRNFFQVSLEKTLLQTHIAAYCVSCKSEETDVGKGRMRLEEKVGASSNRLRTELGSAKHKKLISS